MMIEIGEERVNKSPENWGWVSSRNVYQTAQGRQTGQDNRSSKFHPHALALRHIMCSHAVVVVVPILFLLAKASQACKLVGVVVPVTFESPAKDGHLEFKINRPQLPK